MAGIAQKSALLSSQGALGGHSACVFDIDGVLRLDFDEFFDFCQKINYRAEGFAGKLQSPEEFVEHRVGNCWDWTELQRRWFEHHKYEINTYLLYYRASEDCYPSHSILAYRKDGKWFWFEPMFHDTKVKFSGVHEYNSEDEMLEEFKEVFTRNGQLAGFLPRELTDDKWVLYEYNQPEYGLTDEEFYNHCSKGRRIMV